ncbi:MAG: hypothetical protein IPL36_09605 [Nigerium sp.]|nr:hypothetical protein [Nigerium sp.]
MKDADGALRKTDAAGLLAFPVDLPTASVANAENVTIQVGINNTTDRGTFSTSSTTLPTFQTANVVMNYNHLVQYRQGGTPETGQVHYWLTKSGMELFPGSYSFQFQVPDKKMGNAKAVYPGLTLDLVPGVTVKTAAAVRFTDSAGDGLADGVVRYWRNGVWNYPADGQTDGPGGTWVTLFDGAPGKITFALDYKGGIQQLAQQDLAAASVAYFQTVPVTVKLIDHAGRPLDTGNATFYAQSWKPIGDTVGGQVSTELLPVKHSFAMTYLGSRQQVTVEAVSATPVVFQTGRLTSSDKWISSFYTTSWQTFPAGGVELLPSKVTVRPTTGSQFAVTVEPGEILDLSNG